ncbi:endonuclease/exonuclease/phosphatase family protein [Bacillus sp. MMSF_3328]|uniref:endonuclease/exonuclease/phosphatase family protein n=1 Tax=Bacillus sp. MMSF_3328 TaxID=3047080 RepID=UPI00273F5F39|nr:endonuclease/exonuclease/phosphatase family protein [Bacillus sp. MMSF_3328]
MKIITWNAAMRFREKIDEILPLKADILIIPECESSEKWKENQVKPINQFLWFGDNLNKGLGIITLNNKLHIELHPDYDQQYRYVIPLIVSGEENFILYAIWAQNHKKMYFSYIGQVFMAMQHYAKVLNAPSIIAGDWNSSKNFDHFKKIGTHSETVALLDTFNIYSAYHHYFAEEQGKETHPTHYFRKELERPFHIDYVFMSKEYLDRLTKIEVGTREEWITYSDHLPLIIEID